MTYEDPNHKESQAKRWVSVKYAEKEQIEQVRQLFREYADSLQTDLCFQQFEEELAALPGVYAQPEGAIILVMVDHQPAGCVALKPLSNTICEMKRLFVKRQYRGMGLGRQLVERIIQEAKERKYHYIRLDTLPEMVEAQRMYECFGFYDIAPYVHNPVQGARCMEIKL